MSSERPDSKSGSDEPDAPETPPGASRPAPDVLRPAPDVLRPAPDVLRPAPDVLLSASNLGKRYGDTWVLRGADLSIRRGQITALLGENGAGKSTLVKILSGAVAADTGRVWIDGASVPGGSPAASRNAGIAMVYQELSVCDDLSVADNIMLGRERAIGGWVRRDEQHRIAAAALGRLGHADLDPNRRASELSIGEKQLVEIARGIAGDAKVLILDEPTSSLPIADVESLFQAIGRLAAQGIAVIYISHFLEEVRRLCDHYLVLRDGRTAGQGSLAETTEPEIVRLMVGRNIDDLYPRVPRTRGPRRIALDGISGVRSPHDVSMTVHSGEIVGLAGLVGAGRSESMRCLYGSDPITAGHVVLFETPETDSAQRPETDLAQQPETDSAQRRGRMSPASAIAASIAMVSEDRKGEGLAQNLSIEDNLTLSRLTPYRRCGGLSIRSRRRAVAEWMTRLQIKADDPRQPVGDLSGGNQQKVAIARVLHQAADVLVLDEPTRGVDVGTKAEIYRLVAQAAADGAAVVFVSSYFQELLRTCDTIAVMARGRIVAVRPASQWTEQEMLIAAMGGEKAAAAASPPLTGDVE